MDKKTAIKMMMDGKKVRQPGWAKGDYMYFNGNRFVSFAGDGVNLNNYLSAIHWEIYEEPKKKIKVAPVLFRDADGGYFNSTRWFSSKKEAMDWLEEDWVFISWLIDTPLAQEVEV